MKTKKGNSNLKDIIFSQKFLLILFSIVILLSIILILFYGSIGNYAIKKDKYEELKNILSSFESSELNILFFTLDTTRSDHLGCYGYDEVETPNIDRLAKNGILFKNVICQSPLTLPSHASIFTGTYPFYHNVRDNSGFYLDSSLNTMAEVLKENRWATSAFIGAFVLDSCWGLNQGFDYYYDNFDFAEYKRLSFGSVQREGGEVVKAFLEWFEKKDEKKFFSWIHLFDPHEPYAPPEPYNAKYSITPWGLYDGEIAYVDFLIGKVLDEFRKKELLEKTIIVIVGDHGESLGEHDESTHGFFIYDSAISVPLIIQFPSPKFAGRLVTAQVETIDIMPTLLEMLGLQVPHEVQGKNLIPLIIGENSREERLAYSETYYPRYHYGWSELKSIRSLQYKYIQSPRPELYDLTKDPKERYNIYLENIKIAKILEQKLKLLQENISFDEAEEKRPQKINEEAREKLMALGYVGSYTSHSKLKKKENLPDPKDKINLHNKMRYVIWKLNEEELDEALAEVTGIIKEDPNIIEAREIRARIYLKMNKIEDAIKDCREALKINPEYEEAVFVLSRAYLLQQKIDDAIFHLQQVIEINPKHSAMAHLMLGAAYLKKKMLEQGEIEIRKAIEKRPHIPDAHYNLALIYEERRDFNGAVEEYKKEIELQPKAFAAHFNLGMLYGRLGYRDREIEHLEQAIECKKDFAKGYAFLARAYLDMGIKYDEIKRLAEKSIELSPESEYAPLAHYVIADIYYRLGQIDKYYEEVQKGRRLQKKIE